MGIDKRTLAVAKKYTDNSLQGVGAIAGKPCQIQSITDITGGHRITFLWVDNSSVEHTSTLDVMDGVDGNDGLGIKSVAIDANNHLIITYDDDTTDDAGEVPTVKGDTGEKGDKGDTGVGVPEGGTAGQVLVKKSSTDYDTEWDTPVGGGDMLKSVYDTDDDGKVDSAENADTVDGHTVAKDVPADAVFTDTVYDDTELAGKVSAIEGVIPSDATTSNKLATEDDIPDVSNFITNTVNNLVNYYLKTETYTKTEVDNIATAIKNSRFEVVLTLPTTDIKTNVIYLVPKDPTQTSNVKDEYINLDGTTSGWEKIGDTEIDLSDYVTTQALNTALADYTTTADLTTLLAAKQDTLTFDNVPTENSDNPVKSSGIYADEKSIYEVMGQNGAKNFIPFDLDRIKAKNTTGTWNGNVYSLNGIDFTFNSDGTVDASGTATETASVHYYDPAGLPPFGGDRILRLTGCPSGGGTGTTYKVMAYRAGAVDGSTGTAEDYGDGISLRWLNDGSGVKAFISISVYTGAGTIDLTFKPMLRLASDTDPTYQPYAKTNQELTSDAEALTNQANDMVNVYGAKNLIPYPYYRPSGYTTNGLTVTYDADGILTVNKVAGEAISFFAFANTKDYFLIPNTAYTLSMELENAVNTSVYIKFSNDSSDTAAIRNKATGKYETTFTTPSTFNGSLQLALYYGAIVVETNAKVKVMLRLASIQDDTWVPYVPTNKELMSCKLNGYVGAKNLNSYPYTNTSYVSNGITWTDNGDGTVTANGTATADSYFGCHQRGVNTNNQLIIPNGTYIASGCPDTGSGTTYEIRIERTYNNAVDNLAFVRTMAGKVFTANGDDSFNDHVRLQINLVIRSGATVSNLTFKPMIRRVEDTDPTWQPYAKTNKELTEDVASIMRVVNVSGVSIFDIISDLNSYPAKTEYYGYTASITDGSSALGSLLNTGDYGVVSIKKYSEWHITISIISGNSNGKTHMACTNKNNTSIKFVNNDPAASTDKVTSTTINKAT